MQIDPTLVVFAVLALFVLWKLRSVLGERTGFDGDGAPAPFPQPAAPQAPPPDQGWAEFADRAGGAWAGLDEVARAQPGFAGKPFMDGAKAAYEMVVQAFSRGDEAALHSLASEEVFASFQGAIADRKQRGETMETTFVGFNSAKIVAARVEGPSAIITIRFDSQFITATRDSAGAVIEGDPNRPSSIVDVWSFARRHDAAGPNWTLVSTAPAQ